jgi:hypothetical protein
MTTALALKMVVILKLDVILMSSPVTIMTSVLMIVVFPALDVFTP